jgi:hypothetical protein
VPRDSGQRVEWPYKLPLVVEDENPSPCIDSTDIMSRPTALDAQSNHICVPSILFEQVALKKGMAIAVINTLLVDKRSRVVTFPTFVGIP